MALYSKESLENLRHRVDLVEVVSSYVKMQKSGASYKALCPFHEEKTPSFMIHRGDTHYHCFGCGAHGDAISFLMGYAKMGFLEALEFLSEKFQVALEKEEEQGGGSKARLRAVLERACSWSHFFLLHAQEGRAALTYLYQRGLSLDFLRKFFIGYVPKQGDILWTLLKQEGFSYQELTNCGLLRHYSGRDKDFFSERITFPIRDRMGHVIGFSGRKFMEETTGGKYINTAETVLFKKSQILFGLCYSRQRIAKEGKALIVEGQIDALRLIYEGFDFTVAGQGTAFGEGHVKELLHLGVKQVYLAMDGDKAGQEAAVKIGDLFQNAGVEVLIVSFPEGSDPDAFLQSGGKEAFAALLDKGIDYLTFLYRYLTKGQNLSSPSRKAAIIGDICTRIRRWPHSIMVHESLKKLASLANIPEQALSEGRIVIEQAKTIATQNPLADPDKILEMDLLRWLLLSQEKFAKVLEIVRSNIGVEHFKNAHCADLFSVYMQSADAEKRDLLTLASRLSSEEGHKLLDDLLRRSINPLREEEGTVETVRKLLERNWMERRDQINAQLLKEGLSEEEEASLIKQYNEISKRLPTVSEL